MNVLGPVCMRVRAWWGGYFQDEPLSDGRYLRMREMKDSMHLSEIEDDDDEY